MQDKKHRYQKRQNVVLVGNYTVTQSKEQTLEYLEELAFLAKTVNLTVVKKFIQSLRQINVRFLIGKGKLEEIAEYIASHDIDLVIFDDELSPKQQNNLAKELNTPVLDRTALILDIFAVRAQTSVAKTQVELAQYNYLLPRLTGLWTHLERQKGGIGMRGPGEKELETDRRIVRDKIKRLQEKIKKIDKEQQVQRSNRRQMVRVALVGYTNVGKSTLMNVLSHEKVFAENKLFATLDTTVRKVVYHNLPFLLTDTVGFIRKLPHALVESFKSTLDEVREADILFHVVDFSHNSYLEQLETVEKLLEELDASGKPTIYIFNKIDKLDASEDIENLEKHWLTKGHKAIFISAATKQNVSSLRQLLYDEVKKIHLKRFPHQMLY